jgi:ABC-type transport system substrate-binding protein
MRRPSGSARPRAGPAAALAAALALLASSCPGDRPSPTLPAERPPPAGTLRLGYPEEPPTLNPVTDRSSAAGDLLRPVLPSFFLVTPDLRYEPYLLESPPEVTRDGDRMEIRFRIDEEAVWSDGIPVTVADVAFTWRAMTDPGLAVARPDGFDHLVDVVEESSKSGLLVLEPPLPGWRDLFSAGRFVLPAHAADAPSEVAGWDGGPPVTAGPFLLERWVQGRAVELVADRGFWGPAPLVERIQVAFVPDPTTAIQLLRRGDLDAVAPMLGVSWGRRLGAVPGVEVSRASGPDIVHLVMDAETLDLPARQRVIAAIDRDRFVEVVLGEEGEPADGVLAPEQPGAVPAWRDGPAGGLVGGGELDLAYTRSELLDIVARYIQAELERTGADVELVPLESDVFQGTFLPQGRFDLALWESRTGPSGELWRWVEVPGAGQAVTGLEDRRLAELVEAAAGGDQGALEAAQRRLADLAPVLPLFQPRVTMGRRGGVSGPTANPTIDGPLWNAWAWAKTEA